MRDAMAALRRQAMLDPGIVALVSDRVWVNRLPREVIEAQDPYHPLKMLVLRQAGASGKSDLTPIETIRVTALAYGEDGYEAESVRRAVAQWLHDLERVCDDVMIHHATTAGGAIPLVDPDITWPGVAQTFAVTVETYEEVAA